MQLDLPRDELIEWIGKQLAMGIRNVPPPPSTFTGSSRQKLERLVGLKRDVVKYAREAADKANNVASERWRSIELKHSLFRSELKLRKLDYQLKCVCSKGFDDETTHWGTRIIHLKNPNYNELVIQPALESVSSLTSEADQVWSVVYSGLIETQKRREREEELISSSLSVSPDNLARTKKDLMESYLQERYLLKKQREYRDRLEKSLRERIAALSLELHTVRDLDRVKQVMEESRMSTMNKQIETNERMLEWQLMEEQIRLDREIRDIEARYAPKIDRVQRELIRVSDIAHVESEFVAEKQEVVDMVKSGIEELRRDVKEIETAVSNFRTVLRKDAKIKREQAKVLRE